MGQKVNPIIFRKSNQASTWKLNSYGKNREEAAYYFYQSVAIRNYLDNVFENEGLILTDCSINRSESCMDVNIFFYVTPGIKFKNLTPSSKILKIRSFTQGKPFYKRNMLRVSKRPNLLKPVFKKIFFTKFKNNEFLLVQNNSCGLSFKNKIIKSLLEYTNVSKINLNVKSIQSDTLVNLRVNSSYKKIIQGLRGYSREQFFKEAVEIFFLTSKNFASAKLLARFIAFQLQKMQRTKRHNKFLTFLKRTVFLFMKLKVSDFQGLKIVIRGRFNNAPRSKKRLIQYGRIPLQTVDNEIDYHQTEAFTLSGVFGVKVWVCKKEKNYNVVTT